MALGGPFDPSTPPSDAPPVRTGRDAFGFGLTKPLRAARHLLVATSQRAEPVERPTRPLAARVPLGVRLPCARSPARVRAPHAGPM